MENVGNGLQTRCILRVPTGGWEALHPVLLTGPGQMLRILPSKDRNSGKQGMGLRGPKSQTTYMRPRVCPNSNTRTLSPLQMISRELFHVFFLHAFPGLG